MPQHTTPPAPSYAILSSWYSVTLFTLLSHQNGHSRWAWLEALPSLGPGPVRSQPQGTCAHCYIKGEPRFPFIAHLPAPLRPAPQNLLPQAPKGQLSGLRPSSQGSSLPHPSLSCPSESHLHGSVSRLCRVPAPAASQQP